MEVNKARKGDKDISFKYNHQGRFPKKVIFNQILEEAEEAQH